MYEGDKMPITLARRPVTSYNLTILTQFVNKVSERMGSNHRPHAPKARVLPLDYAQKIKGRSSAIADA